jgi:hypothetical protein
VALAAILRRPAGLYIWGQRVAGVRGGRWGWPAAVRSHLLTEPGQLRLVAVTANGQPAFAVYQREPGGAYHAHAVLVLTVTPTGIARIVSFRNPDLFRSFGLPQEHRAA